MRENCILERNRGLSQREFRNLGVGLFSECSLLYVVEKFGDYIGNCRRGQRNSPSAICCVVLRSW